MTGIFTKVSGSTDKNLQQQSSLSAIGQTSCTATSTQVLLATAMVQVFDRKGTPVICRALLDPGSQLHFISEHVAHTLGIKRQKTCTPIIGIGSTEVVTKQKITITMKSLDSKFSTELEAHVLPKVSEMQPDRFLDIHKLELPPGLKLADPTFYQPSPIDILIGVGLYADILNQDQLRLANGFPLLQSTQFGWVMMGRASTKSGEKFQCSIAVKPSISNLERLVQQFWEIEAHDKPNKPMTEEEQMCELYFSKSVERSASGKFIVRLPFKEAPIQLGESLGPAKRRFTTLERKLNRDSELKGEYRKFMEDYERLGHMERLSALPENHYVMPHHSIQKPESSSTKLRVVFDASAKSSSGKSLNDILMVGPTIQSNLVSIMIRFRLHRYVFTSDICKMYRQILVHPEDRKYQLIVWRNEPENSTDLYQLNILTYGTSSAPYLATRCLLQLSSEQQDDFPLAAAALRRDTYMDDCMTCSYSLEHARQLQLHLIEILKRGNFELRKFCANHPKLLEGIPEEHKERFLSIHQNNVIKTLGLIWQPDLDVFQFHIAEGVSSNITKRTVLSEVARIFDPLGLIGPVVVMGKIFLQELWKLHVHWDAELPEEYQIKWISYREQLGVLSELQIPRFVLSSDHTSKVQLHAFADSSEVAYGACCYLRSINDQGRIQVQLLCSKSRVAPIKSTTLPKLELCAALLMVELANNLLDIIPTKTEDIYYYTDSEIVLAWLSAPSYTWNTFVANRVAKIQDHTTLEQWRHIDTKENPADLVSRGVQVRILLQSRLWFHGPDLLNQPEGSWPERRNKGTRAIIPETRKLRLTLLAKQKPVDLIVGVKYNNSLPKLERIFAYCYRFVSNTKAKEHNKDCIHGSVTTSEVETALRGVLWNVQQTSFFTEYTCLKKTKEVHGSSRSLCPFVDRHDLIRVGGRLQNSQGSYDSKHPILLPKAHPITKLIMTSFHLRNMHAAPQSLLSFIRQRYWPIDGKNLARRIVHECIRCFRSKPRGIQQVMGNLPAERVEPSKPFLNVGIDFCGPFKIYVRIRGKTPTKGYVAVFVCFATKAVHLELVSDLSSEAFIAALRRFIGRRGLCRVVFCDSATNFVGARNELEELRRLFESQHHQQLVQTMCQDNRIVWKPIPPRSPHFGGLWEAAVKVAKYYLVRTVSSASLTYEELSTIIIQIEAIMNSRPLTPLSSDPNDLEALTPGHFLIGGPLNSFAEPDVTNVNDNRLTRFRRLQKMKQVFWCRWSHEYLHLLQQRHKWSSKGADIKENVLVLLGEDGLPPYKWLLGGVIKLYLGKDNNIRVADVKTQHGVYKRAITKLYPLPLELEVENT